MAGGVEEGVGVVGGEALIEEVVGEGGVGFAKGRGEDLGFDGLGAGCAVSVERVADEEGFDFVLADKAGDGLEVCTEGGSVEGEERLGGETEGVGDGDADAAVSNVEREDAGGWRLFGHKVSVRAEALGGKGQGSIGRCRASGYFDCASR